MAARIVLIDGNALVHRAFHALPPLTSPRGEFVNATYGVASMLLKVLAELHPEYVAAAFDTTVPSFRHREYAAYKAQQGPAPEGLSEQFARVHEFMDAMGIPTYHLDGFEADDILGSLTRQAREQGLDVVILTGDTDALQLVAPGVEVLTSRRGFSDTVLYGEQGVQERYGIPASGLVDLKGLKGDTSDNILGVPGISEKTASKLIAEYGTLEGIYGNLDKLTPKLKQLLETHRDQAFHSRYLSRIVTDVPVRLELDRCRAGAYDRHRLVEFFRELGFKSLADRIPRESAAKSAARANPLTATDHRHEQPRGLERKYNMDTQAGQVPESSNMSAGPTHLGSSLRIYLSTSTRRDGDSQYPSVLAAVREHFPHPIELLEPMSLFSSVQDWQAKWPALLRTIDLLVVYPAWNRLYLASFQELADCQHAGIPILAYVPHCKKPWLDRFTVYAHGDGWREHGFFATIDWKPPEAGEVIRVGPQPQLAARTRQGDSTEIEHTGIACKQPSQQQSVPLEGEIDLPSPARAIAGPAGEATTTLDRLTTGSAQTNPTQPGLAEPVPRTSASALASNMTFSRYETLCNLERKYRQKTLDKVYHGQCLGSGQDTCYLITTQHEDIHVRQYPDAAARALLADTRVIPGITDWTRDSLAEGGYPTVRDLLHHPKYGSAAAEYAALVDGREAARLSSWLGGRKLLPRSHPLCFYPSAFVDVERLVFMDIEMMGRDIESIFLVGIARVIDGSVRTLQYLARKLDEEPAMLASSMPHFAGADAVVTFNGRSFDIPRMRNRAEYFGLQAEFPDHHIDLLHFTKRAWGNKLPDGTLSTIERHVLGIERAEDVPGEVVPDFYRSYLETENIGPLVPIIEHNRQDLVSIVRLFSALHDGWGRHDDSC